MKLSKSIWLGTLGFILFISFFAVFPISSAFSIIQDNSALLSNNCGALSTGSNAFTSPVTAGDTIIAMVAYSSGSAQVSHDIVVSDNVSDVFHRAITANLTSGVAGQYIVHVGIFYVPSAIGGKTSVQCTITSGSGGNTILSIFETQSAIFVQETNNTFPTGNINSPGVTIGSTNPASQLVFSSIALNGAIAGTLSCTCSLFNNLGNGIQNALADGTGAGKWTATANFQYVEVDAGFGANFVTITSTSTVTGWQYPNFVNGQNSFSWFYFIIIGFFPLGITEFFLFKTGSVGDKTLLFFNLGAMAVGATIGSMLGFSPIGLVPIFWGIFILFVWRFRD